MIHIITKADWISYFDYHNALMISNQLPQGKMIGLIFSAFAAIILLIGGTSMYFQKKDL
jgi:predicted lipase